MNHNCSPDLVAQIVDKPRHLAGAAGQFQHARGRRRQMVAHRLRPCCGLAARRDAVAKGEVKGPGPAGPVIADVFGQVVVRGHCALSAMIFSKRSFARAGRVSGNVTSGASPTLTSITMPMAKCGLHLMP